MSTAAAANPMGLKRICMNCGARFYDMNKRPITCPSCDTEFTGEIKVKGRRGRVAAETKKEEPKKEEAQVEENEDDVLEDEDDGVEVVSLDDVETDTDDTAKPLSSDDNDEDLEEIPDFEETEIDDELGGDDEDTLLESDDD